MTNLLRYWEKIFRWKAGHRKFLEGLYQQFMAATEQTDQAISRWLKN